jgi:hypothetical protein
VSEDAHPDYPGQTNPLRRTLDLFVFAPFGVVLTVAEDLPGLISKGRERLEQEISNARVVGEFVVGQGQREMTKLVGNLLSRDRGEQPARSEATEATGDTPGQSNPPASPPAPPKPAPNPADAVLVEHALAGYDTLSASQVVRRLESLGPEELRAVHRHEASHRNRRTILNRTNQILGVASTDSTPVE